MKVLRTDISDSVRHSNFSPQWGGYYGSGSNEEPNVAVRLAIGDQLKTLKWQRRLARLQSFRQQARIQQADNRMQQAIDEDFYDSIQLELEDIAVLEERRQPVLTYNIIKDTVNWILGMEKKVRLDYDLRPRSDGAMQEAKIKEDVLKFDSDVNYFQYVMSQGFASAMKAGVGWIDLGAKNGEDSPLYVRNEKWRNVWFDHLAVGLVGRKPRFVIREKWVDLDIAEVLFENSADDLRAMSEHVNAIYPYNPDDIVLSDPASEFDVEGQLDSMFSPRGETLRERIKVCECQYRMPAKVKILRLVDPSIPYGCLEGSIYRKGNADQDYLVKNGYFETYEVMKMVVRQAFWCGTVYLRDNLSPYDHWEFSLQPIWCYIRERDNMPYGIIRDLRDPQIDLNKRRSKALFLMSSTQIIAEKGAVDDKQEAVNEAQRPDGFIEYNSGKKIEIQRNLDLSNAHLNMAHDDERLIHSLVGHVEPEMAQTKKEISGTALDSMKEGMQITSSVIFDNYYFAHQTIGEIRIALVEQFWTEFKEIMVNAGTKQQRFEAVNQLQQDGTVKNPITKSKARFVLGKRDYRESVRMAMFEALSNIVMYLSKTAPEYALKVLDLLVDFMDDLGPIKDELVARIRELNGQMPPIADMSDQEKQEAMKKKQGQAQEKQLAKALQQAMAQAKVRHEQAKADSEEGRAAKNKEEGFVKMLEGFLKALEEAELIQGNPTIVEAADLLIGEARKIQVPANSTGASEQGANAGGNRQIAPQGQEGGM